MANRADNFTRANSTTGLGFPSDSGSAWAEFNAGGGASLGIISNQAYDVYDASAQIVGYLDSGSADTTVQVTLATFADQMGLAARATDYSNFIFIRAYSGAGYDLFKRVANSSINLGSYSTTPADGDVIALVMSGSSLTVKVNGVTRITATDSFNATATLHGIWASSEYFNAGRWSTFSITDPGNTDLGFVIPPVYRDQRASKLQVIAY